MVGYIIAGQWLDYWRIIVGQLSADDEPPQSPAWNHALVGGVLTYWTPPT